MILQLSGKIAQEALIGPFTKGLSHNPERYAAKGIRADTPYPGLYVGGSDLTVGDSFSGSIVGSWLAANAVMGYGTLDLLFLEKNITSDLERFLDPQSPVCGHSRRYVYVTCGGGRDARGERASQREGKSKFYYPEGR